MSRSNRSFISFLAIVAVSVLGSNLPAQIWHTDYQYFQTRSSTPMWHYYGVNPYARYRAPRIQQCNRAQVYLVYPRHQQTYSVQNFARPVVAATQSTYMPVQLQSVSSFPIKQTYASQPALAIEFETSSYGAVYESTGYESSGYQAVGQNMYDDVGVLISDSAESAFSDAPYPTNEVIGEVVRPDSDVVELNDQEIEQAVQDLDEMSPDKENLAPSEATSIVDDVVSEAERDKLQHELDEANAKAKALEEELGKLKEDQ